MKRQWLDRYMDVAEKEQGTADILTGFNANIDVIHDIENLDIDFTDVEAEHVGKVSDMEDFKKELGYAYKEEVNEEVELEIDPELDGGDERLGGQAGIMSNFLSDQGNGVIFYTPLLSPELAEKMNEKVLTPVMDGKFVLKNIKDASTTDRTKRNIIVECSGEKTTRVIFSRKMKGFGPYFRKGVEDNLSQIEENIDRAIVSGFHDVEGNLEAKLEKSRRQLKKISKPVHLEYVQREETDELIVEQIIPEVDSIGLDEEEAKKLAEVLGLELEGDLALGDAFHLSRKLIEDKGLKRVHIHTFDYHVTITSNRYPVEKKKVREAMLYGELSAILAAEKGDTPEKEDYPEFDMENKHIHVMDELEHFQHFFELDNFVNTGMAEVDGLNVVAIPTIIHEDPERVVGLGDIISAGSFVGELR